MGGNVLSETFQQRGLFFPGPGAAPDGFPEFAESLFVHAFLDVINRTRLEVALRQALRKTVPATPRSADRV